MTESSQKPVGQPAGRKNLFRLVRQLLMWAGASVVLVLIVAWLSGWFVEKLPPGQVKAEMKLTGPAKFLVQVQREIHPAMLRVVGSVQAMEEVSVSSRVLAEVKKILIQPGGTAGNQQVLIELDDRDLQARVAQAEANLEAAQARLAQAQSDYEKLKLMVETEAANQREFEDAQRQLAVAKAQSRQANEALSEAKTLLDYATIRAPMQGKVIDILVDPGDLAQPGQPLVLMESRLQLVASVPESVAMDLSLNDKVQVEVDALGLRCEGTVSEIIAQASPLSRSFTVKVSGPCPPGVISGMFGRMLLPRGERERLVIPSQAVRRVGQLEIVFAATKKPDESSDAAIVGLAKRFVRTARIDDQHVEVLSGLESGDWVLSDAKLAGGNHE